MKKLIYNICKNNKDKVAYKTLNNYITYKELWKKAYNLACFFSNKNYKRLLIIGNNETEEFILIVACLIANITYIPVNYDIPLGRLEKILKDSNPDLVIDIQNYDLDIRHEYNRIIPNENNIAYIIYTSGSTGLPKGVPISYKNLNNFIEWLNYKSYLKTTNQNVLNTASFSFDLSVADLFFSISNGLTLYSIRNMDINEEKLSFIKDINYIFATPSHIKMFLLNERFNDMYLKKLKYIFFCGELLEQNIVKKLFKRFKGIKIINAYGPTECTCAVTSILIKQNMLNGNLPIGDLRTAACKIYLKNEEIIIEGNSVFDGYLNMEKKANKFNTKDIGRIIDNKLYFLGRKDNQIKIGGYRIEIEEIENIIKRVYNINEVIIIPIKNKGRIINLKCILKESIDLKKLDNEIPYYMIPNTVEIVKEFIYTKNNKLDRKAMNEKYSC